MSGPNGIGAACPPASCLTALFGEMTLADGAKAKPKDDIKKPESGSAVAQNGAVKAAEAAHQAELLQLSVLQQTAGSGSAAAVLPSTAAAVAPPLAPTPKTEAWTTYPIGSGVHCALTFFRYWVLGPIFEKRNKKIKDAVDKLEIAKLLTVGDVEVEGIAIINLTESDLKKRHAQHAILKKYLVLYTKGLTALTSQLCKDYK